MNENKTIVVFSAEMPSSEQIDLGGGWREKIGSVVKENAINVNLLEGNIRNFFVSFTNILESSSVVEKNGFKLDTIEFSLNIGAKGQVGILGNGAEANASGGIKFVIKRG